MRFALNDGPGIRTTVFLKGCPLHCHWCHNPESIATGKEIVLREDRCIRCGDCSTICEQHAIHKAGERYVTDRELCIQCGRCIDVCYSEARSFAGDEVTTEQIVKEILKDVPFYDESGGGVTFSGGEPLLQYEFLLSLLQACKERAIHTAVDTTGFTSYSILEIVSKFVDLYLYDLKTLDDVKHLEFTGVSNKIIIENLKRLVDWGKQMIVRIPLIPGLNDENGSILQTAEFIGSLGSINEIHLLPYHKSGIEKYSRLGKIYPMNTKEPPSRETMLRLADRLKEFVPIVSIGG